MGYIRLMDEPLSNKIAAGEVVERPASVVKELVENALDAGGTVVEVLLEEAGLMRVQVIDNGSGMDREDAVLSFARHATSKITNEHDLFRIRTLGFRGEALASIASVSKVMLHTSDGESGTLIRSEGSTITEERAASLRKGTDIAVEQLFFNTPARLKYMKTLQTELGHVIDLMNRFALSCPAVSFRLVHGGKVLLETAGSGDIRRVLADIYGMQVARKMVPFEGGTHDYKVTGYASLPEITRANKNYISVFVNGRWVKQYAAARAVQKAYHTFLPIDRHPIVVLNIEGDPYLTDVNVHPSKQQIRLSKEGELMQLIEQAIGTAIRSAVRAPAVEKKPAVRQEKKSDQLDIWKSADRVKERPVPKENAETQSPAAATWRQAEPAAAVEAARKESDAMPNPMIGAEPVAEAAGREGRQEPKPAAEPQADWSTDPEPAEEQFPELEVVGQIHGTYIVAQSSDGFYLIDQHAAQERIKYEFYREKVGQVDRDERQSLLLPLTFHYSRDEAYRLRESLDVLEENGVYLEEFGDTSFIVREHPTWFPAGFEQEVVEDLIEQVLTDRKADVKKLREEAAIMMSCKRSIKANHYLQKQDMERLLVDLKAAEQPFTCPHGRPVIVHFTSYDLEKMFKRVM
ncbi:DNA mismatch repair endonuclease MutL [Planococcus lenghuensis]|uniref:DNA mismatch repair protein MutL n=1 Tax=Planococcus lenghuensis TaxID=2213202 RepID=A0A1Q2KZR4_9BACL|nr:DNA mismatch repair endonuclease MutL [Planococcus lenghuensis]AQQ53690.1 DNA mismatch repair protein MutL [Planococcus lenghuensis]